MSSITLNAINTYNLDNIMNAYPTTSTFYLSPGSYIVTKTLVIYREDIRIIGITNKSSDVTITQQHPTDVLIRLESDNTGLESLSLINDGGMCVTQRSCSWTSINNCHFYSTNATDVIIYEGSNGGFDMRNTFDNNIIYAGTTHSAIIFKCQEFGSIRDNIIRGNKIVCVQLKEIIISHNIISDSVGQCINIALPCIKLNVTHNACHRMASAAIKVTMDTSNTLIVTSDVNITHNYITSCNFIAIELNNAKDVNIEHNIIKWSKEAALYLLGCSDVSVKNNTCVQFMRGLQCDVGSVNNTFSDNIFYSVFPYLSDHAIMISMDAQNNACFDNKSYGSYNSSIIRDGHESNTVNNNTHIPYISIGDELLVCSMNFPQL